MGSYRRGGLIEFARVTIASALAIVFGIFVVALIPLYDRFDRDSGGPLLPAYAVACLGVLFAVVVAVDRVVGRWRTGMPIGWAPLVAVPVLAESWLVGLLVALVLVTI